MTPLSRHSVEQCYRRYFPLIKAKCLRMLREEMEAQDIAQETFTRLWAERHRIRDVQALTAWVYRTSTRLAIDRVRSRKRLTSMREAVFDHISVESACAPTPEDYARWQDAAAQLGRIPRKEMEIVILSRLDGLTQEEIATVTGRSPRTVRRVLARLDDRFSRLRERVR